MKKLSNVTLMGIDCVNVERIQKALDISSHDIEFGEVKLLTSLSTNDKRKIEISPINSLEEYSKFCIRDLYKYVKTDYVLIVQHDGFILNPESWEDNFLNYDYIGAPWLVADWSIDKYNFPENLRGTRVVGNGGFSLRSKRFLLMTARLADQGVFNEYNPEDIVLCVWNRKEVEGSGMVFAPVDVAARFSIESDDDISDPNSGDYDKQFGFHGLRWTNISKWIKKNPQWGIKQIPD